MSILDNLLKGVAFLKDIKNAFINTDKLNDTTGYTIQIGLGYPPEEREIALIHEIIHAAYDVKTYWYPVEKEREIPELERIIEDEAQRFCRENPNFVKTVYQNLVQKYGCSE
mgnify:CR=1 FL=1